MRVRPIISIVFDDNSETVYTEAYPRMKALGLTGSQFIIGYNFGSAGIISKAQLAVMYNDGWDVGNHTTGHQNLTELTNDTDRISVIGGGKTVLDNEGWTRSSGLFVPPYNAVNDAALSVIAKYSRFSTGGEGYNTISSIDKYNILRKGAGTNTVNTIKGFIDEAIANNYYLHLYFHGIAEPIGYNYPPSMFQEIIDYIAVKRDAGLLEVLTCSQVADELNTSSITISK